MLIPAALGSQKPQIAAIDTHLEYQIHARDEPHIAQRGNSRINAITHAAIRLPRALEITEARPMRDGLRSTGYFRTPSYSGVRGQIGCYDSSAGLRSTVVVSSLALMAMATAPLLIRQARAMRDVQVLALPRPSSLCGQHTPGAGHYTSALSILACS
ncbi:hypothetical protein K438DRAFT_1989080 [Mycena galopus ATCC 62051]|nr:hypothetical protein K438DRAFT_1989080 [Mycena galopus ATCC 62051]